MDSPALDRLATYLRCPVCCDGLTVAGPAANAGRTLVCPQRHSFDVARQGYVSLATGGLPQADTASMVEARDEFLGSGHYAPIADGVVRALTDAAPGPFVDLAGGTGYYAARTLDASEGRWAIVVDASKYALRRAARAHHRLAAVGADVWKTLPVRSGAASAALSIFGPRNPDEIRRILTPGGILVVVTPNADHLGRLRDELELLDVDERKTTRLAARLAEFDAVASTDVDYELRLGGNDLFTAAMMGPNAFHRDPAEIRARIDRLPAPLAVTVSVRIGVYRPR